MNAAYFRELYAYSFWMSRQVWSCLEELTDEQFQRPLEYSLGSLQDQCVHVLGVEFWWFRFLATGRLEFVDVDALTNRPAIRAQWDAVEEEVMAYLVGLTEAEIVRQVKPEFWGPEPQPVGVWQTLLQVANHSTDHRAQILAGLHTVGGRTLEQDYLQFHFQADSSRVDQ